MSNKDSYEAMRRSREYLDVKNSYYFLKYSYQYAAEFKKVKQINFRETFPFIKEDRPRISANTSVKDYPLEYFKNEVSKNFELGDSKSVQHIQEISGIYNRKEELNNYITSLLPGSFGIWIKFRLETPFYSSDDDPVYIVNNPVLKERTWKIPMMRGSSWKGVLLASAKQHLKEALKQKDFESFFRIYFQIYRIFGTGSHEFRAVEEMIREAMKMVEDEQRFEPLLRYALFELGVNLTIKHDKGQTVAEQLLQHIKEYYNYDRRFAVHRGRALFFPTYFNSCSLEVINPHSRERRTGTNPIFYEVVPEGTEGIFQLIYIPHDGVLLPDERVKREAEEDKTFLESLFSAVCNNGIGAKTKMWGKMKVVGENE